MYNIDYKKIKSKSVAFYILLVFGIIMLLFMSYTFFIGIYKKSKTDSSIKAFKIDENCYESYDSDSGYTTTCNPDYHYIVNGKEYICASYFGKSEAPCENEKMVYYDSKNPSYCVTSYDINYSKYLYLIFLIPFSFIIMSLLFIRKNNKVIEKIKYLSNYGTLVKGLPYEMVSSNMTINKVPYYHAIVEYKFMNEVKKLKSESFPINYFNNKDKIDLIYDQTDNSKYYIDFDIK